MDFPIFTLLDEDVSIRLKCPHCGTRVEEARARFRTTVKSRLTVYRRPCQGLYNLYSGTVFEGKHFHQWCSCYVACARPPCFDVARTETKPSDRPRYAQVDTG